MSSEYRFDVVNGYSILGDVNGDGEITALDGQILLSVFLEAIVISGYDNIDDLIDYVRSETEYTTTDDGWFFRGDIDCKGDIGSAAQAQWVQQYFLQTLMDDPLPFAHFLNIYGTGDLAQEDEDTPPN